MKYKVQFVKTVVKISFEKSKNSVTAVYVSKVNFAKINKGTWKLIFVK